MFLSSWYQKTTEEIFTELQTSTKGLTELEVKDRLKKYGNNSLPEEKRISIFSIFLHQFNSPLIYVLLGASGVVLFLGEVVDAVVIFVVLIINAVIGSIQEGRARSAIEALKNFVATEATVVRSGEEVTIADNLLVPGDLILLYEGEKVPADARIILSNNLQINESSLTGESEPVRKISSVLDQGKNLPITEQTNMVFKGSTVTSGSARAVVVATGLETVIGSIAQKITTIDSEIPLQTNIRNLSRLIVLIVGVVGLFLFLIGVSLGHTPEVMFTTVVSLAVSVIPEGLPIVMTVILATGVWRMSKRNALVKKMQAVEALGQANIIAVDKTGTITQNEMVVRKIWSAGDLFEVSGIGYSKYGEVTLGGNLVSTQSHNALARLGLALARGANAHLLFDNKTQQTKIAGDPTEAALMVLSSKLGFNKEEVLADSPIVVDLPFDYKLKYKAVVTKDEHSHTLTLIGAPEAVLDLATHVRVGDRLELLSKERKSELQIVFETLSEEGLRVVGCAVASRVSANSTPTNVSTLVFEGFLAMQDALRAEVKGAVRKAEQAGIKVVMITGDHKTTAQSIAKQAGIYKEGDIILTGPEVESLSDQDLADKLPLVSVYARVTPEHKLRIVEAYKSLGLVIAMTGDGVNDAPSLVAANLGVGMGKIGTEVAKEASDIILLDDNFESIVSAIEEGRSIYKTMQKAMVYLFSTSLGEALVIILAIVFGYPLPILAVQIIWLNLVTDGFLALPLAVDPKEKNLLTKKFNKPSKFLVDRLMLVRMVVMSLPMTIGTLYVFSLYYEADIVKAWTMSLVTMAVFQWFNAWNCRSESDSVFAVNPFNNLYLVGATILVVGLQIFSLYNPFFQFILKTVPITLNDWLLVLPIAFSIVVVEEIRKIFYRLRKI